MRWTGTQGLKGGREEEKEEVDHAPRSLSLSFYRPARLVPQSASASCCFMVDDDTCQKVRKGLASQPASPPPSKQLSVPGQGGREEGRRRGRAGRGRGCALGPSEHGQGSPPSLLERACCSPFLALLFPSVLRR